MGEYTLWDRVKEKAIAFGDSLVDYLVETAKWVGKNPVKVLVVAAVGDAFEIFDKALWVVQKVAQGVSLLF